MERDGEQAWHRVGAELRRSGGRSSPPSTAPGTKTTTPNTLSAVNGHVPYAIMNGSTGDFTQRGARYAWTRCTGG